MMVGCIALHEILFTTHLKLSVNFRRAEGNASIAWLTLYRGDGIEKAWNGQIDAYIKSENLEWSTMVQVQV